MIPAADSKPSSRALHLRNERLLLNGLLSSALAGDTACRDRLFAWVHRSALDYYSSKNGVEPLLTPQDAQDLASECIVEFSKCWRRVRSVSHYCRRMYKNNLHRFLKRQRRLINRECTLIPQEMERVAQDAIMMEPTFDFEKFSDEDWRRIRFASSELETADTVMKEIFRCRVFVGSQTYAEIAERIGATETSLRMRMARFNRRVKLRYERDGVRTLGKAA